jgi:hypothetical protein
MYLRLFAMRSTLFSRQTHIHPALTEVQALVLQAGNQLLSCLFDALLRRDVDSEPWLARVPFPVLESRYTLVETKEDYLRLIQRRVVLRNCVIFAAIERIIANDGLDVSELALGELIGRVHEGIEVVEQQEGRGGVLERLG